MDQEQRQSIVGYLVAIHGPNSTIEGSPARNEDSDFTSTAKPEARIETAPLLKLAADATEHLSEVSHGVDLFKQDCAVCHGTAGRGDGWVVEVLLRRPKDLAASRFSLRLLSQGLWDGKRGTAMPSWRALPQSDLAGFAAYVQTLHQPSRPEMIASEAINHGRVLAFQPGKEPTYPVIKGILLSGVLGYGIL
ncbi:MAG: cytochrome c [Verrucomicrobia bacterium]|nr:cytochrome c [Verrucomicrobiota bacterium]